MGKLTPRYELLQHTSQESMCMDVLGPARDLVTRKAIDLQIDYDSLASVEPAGAEERS